MEWYFPMTIIPGIGILILSTSNIMLTLNNEISVLKKEDKDYSTILVLKLAQLKRLSISIVFKYVGVFFFLSSGILKVIFDTREVIQKVLVAVGVFSTCFAIFILIIYSIKAVSIRQKHLHL